MAHPPPGGIPAATGTYPGVSQGSGHAEGERMTQDPAASKPVEATEEGAASQTLPTSVVGRGRSWDEFSQSYMNLARTVVQSVKEAGNRVIYAMAELDPSSETNLPTQVHMLGMTYEVTPVGSLHRSSMNSSSMYSSASQKPGSPGNTFGASATMGSSSLSSSTASTNMVCEGARAFRQDMRSLLWFTYRHGLQPITDWGITTDAGWGCMLRSAQMMFAQALSVHALGRSWRIPDLEYPQMSQAYRSILELFADHPSAPMSIHRIARAGEEVGKKAGQWLGPNTVCSALHRLHAKGAFGERCNLQMVLFDSNDGDNTIYRSECKTKLQKGPLFILLPVRLGTYTIDKSYVPKVAAIFQLTQSLGFIGGRPKSAHYFVASRGNLVYFLDPHTTQPYVPLPPLCREGPPDRHRSWHCDVQRRMNLKDIDASLTFGFYCRDEDDLDSLCEGIENINQSLGGYPAVSVAEDRQHYDSQNAWDQDDDDEGCLASSHDSDEESHAHLAESQSDGSESDTGFAPLAVSRSHSHCKVEDCAPLAASSLVASVEEPKLPASQ